MTRTDAEKKQIVLACQAIIDAVKAGGDLGAPGGVLYAALLDQLTLEQFESLMRGIVGAGCLRKSGELYFFVKNLIEPTAR